MHPRPSGYALYLDPLHNGVHNTVQHRTDMLMQQTKKDIWSIPCFIP